MSELIHIFWAQGWEQAPPKALRNLECWEQVGEVRRWCDASARAEGLLHKEVTPDAAPALRCDIVLAAAQFKFGGLAVDADMKPLRLDRIRHELEFLSLGGGEKGMAVYSTFGDQPYNVASWFSKGSAWIRCVHGSHLNVVASDPQEPRDIGALTGPRLWRALIERNVSLWLREVRTYHAMRVFSFENESRKFRNSRGWIDPGLHGDWLGQNPEVWR